MAKRPNYGVKVRLDLRCPMPDGVELSTDVYLPDAAGGLVICDCCPVESHMRTSTCKEFGLESPQIDAMVTDSCKMARYIGDLIGCRTVLRNREQCLHATTARRLT